MNEWTSNVMLAGLLIWKEINEQYIILPEVTSNVRVANLN